MKKTKEAGIYKKKDGRLWIRTEAKCPIENRFVQKTFTMKHGQTIKEALEKKKEMQDEIRGRTARDRRPITVADYAAIWLEKKSNRNRKPSTLAKWEQHLSDHILPEIGHYILSEITREHVDDWVAWAECQVMDTGEVYSYETIAGWFRTMKPMLLDAWGEGLIEIDPTRRVMPPQRTHAHRKKGKVREQETLTEAQLAEFLKVLRTNERFQARHAEIATIALTGMRPGELYALKWDDINIGDRSIRLDESAWKDYIGPTKTGDPRTAAMHHYLVPVLEDHRRQQMLDQHPGLRMGLVFPANTGRPRMSQSLTKVFKAASAECSFDTRVGCQVLRRTLNTLLRQHGVHDGILQGQMGHCDIRMTHHYDSRPLSDKRAGIDHLQL